MIAPNVGVADIGPRSRTGIYDTGRDYPMFYVLTPGGACYPAVGASLDIGAPSIKVSQDGHGLVAVIAPARDL